MRDICTALLIVPFLVACTTGDMIRAARIATTGDVTAAQRMAAEKAVKYATDPKSLDRDIRRFRKDFAKLVRTFIQIVEGVWGRKEAKAPKQKEYVKYTHNYLLYIILSIGYTSESTTIQRKENDLCHNKKITS